MTAVNEPEAEINIVLPIEHLTPEYEVPAREPAKQLRWPGHLPTVWFWELARKVNPGLVGEWLTRYFMVESAARVQQSR